MYTVTARSKWLVILVAGVFLFLSAGSSAGSATELRIGIHTDEGPLTPYGYTFGNPGLQLVRVVYDSLFIMDADRSLVPWMVEDYEVSADGLVWTLRLHEGMTFHDGAPVTSADVKFSYTYMTQHSHSVWQRSLRGIEAIDTPDPLTVVIRLERPNPIFRQRPLAEVPIIPAHIWEGMTEPRAFTDATGSGPYRVAEYRPGHFYRFEAHPDYFHPEWKPALESIVMPIIPDSTTMFMSLKAGEVDMSTREVPPELVDELARTPGVKIVQGPSYVSTLLLINNEREPFRQVDFRRALALAVDVEYIVDVIRLGYGTPGSLGFVHPMSPWLGQPAASWKQDFEQARQLLEGLGFVDRTGDGYREDPAGNRFTQSILVYANRPERIRVAEIITDWFKEIGLRTAVRAMEAATVDALVWPEFDVTKGRDYDLAIWGWSAGIQEIPLTIREVFHTAGSNNVGAFSDEEMDELATRLLRVTDLDQIRPIMQEIARVAADRVPFVTLWYPDGIYGYRSPAYDGWVYVRGVGILDKVSLLSPVDGAAEPADARAGAEGNWSWFLGVLALLAVGFVVYRVRRKG